MNWGNRKLVDFGKHVGKPEAWNPNERDQQPQNILNPRQDHLESLQSKVVRCGSGHPRCLVELLMLWDLYFLIFSKLEISSQRTQTTDSHSEWVLREAESTTGLAPWEIEEETEDERQARYAREADEMKLKWDARQEAQVKWI